MDVVLFIFAGIGLCVTVVLAIARFQPAQSREICVFFAAQAEAQEAYLAKRREAKNQYRNQFLMSQSSLPADCGTTNIGGDFSEVAR